MSTALATLKPHVAASYVTANENAAGAQPETMEVEVSHMTHHMTIM